MIKHTILAAFLFGIVSSVRAQHFPNDWENETIIAKGKMPARATSYSYSTADPPRIDRTNPVSSVFM